MTLQYIVNSLTEIPAERQSLYAETDGIFVLQVEGAGNRKDLNDLRESNITIRRQIEDISARYDGVDPDFYRTLLRQEREAALIADGRIDEVIQARVAPLQAAHTQLMDGLTRERDAAVKQADVFLIDDALRDAAVKADVQPGAIDDVLLRGRQTFRVEDGKVVAYQGDAPLLGRHNAPLGVPEWMAYLGRIAPHFFEPSASGNAPGGSQQRGGQGLTITRAQFGRLDPWERAEAARTKRIVD